MKASRLHLCSKIRGARNSRAPVKLHLNLNSNSVFIKLANEFTQNRNDLQII